jgi:RimJ/RimL family protein N-acetyltransferase
MQSKHSTMCSVDLKQAGARAGRGPVRQDAPGLACAPGTPGPARWQDGHMLGESPVVTLSDGLVTLRPWSRDDARFMAEASADPAIRRYNGSHDRLGHPIPPPSTTDAEAVIDQFALNWRAFAATGTPSGVAFAILDTRSGELVGCCGVDNWSKEDVAQFGYWIAPNARGRGYGTRAAILLTRWLFDVGAARVFLTIVAGNEGSVAVARRAGFVYEGTMRAHGVWQGKRCDVMWFAALPLEWAMRRPDEETQRATGVAPAGDRGAF